MSQKQSLIDEQPNSTGKGLQHHLNGKVRNRALRYKFQKPKQGCVSVQTLEHKNSAFRPKPAFDTKVILTFSSFELDSVQGPKIEGGQAKLEYPALLLAPKEFNRQCWSACLCHRNIADQTAESTQLCHQSTHCPTTSALTHGTHTTFKSCCGLADWRILAKLACRAGRRIHELLDAEGD